MKKKFQVGDEVAFLVSGNKFAGKVGTIIDDGAIVNDWKTGEWTTQYAMTVKDGDGEYAYFIERQLQLIKSIVDTNLLDWLEAI